MRPSATQPCPEVVHTYYTTSVNPMQTEGGGRPQPPPPLRSVLRGLCYAQDGVRFLHRVPAELPGPGDFQPALAT